MASEIQILITAVDNATKTINEIKSSIDKSGDAIQKQNEKTNSSFDEQVKSLIAVGNLAKSVEGIFDSYNNYQLRVENATERLANANDRLVDAQKNLLKVQEDVTSSSEDIEKAQTEVDRATRSLTISQNNLQKVNNQAVGLYITMGVNMLSAAQSLKALTAGTSLAKIAEQAYSVAKAIGLALMGPYGWAILAGAAAVGAIAVATIKATDAQNDYNTSLNNVHVPDALEKIQRIYQEISGQDTALTKGMSEAEYKAQGDILDLTKDKLSKEQELADLRASDAYKTINFDDPESVRLNKLAQQRAVDLQKEIQADNMKIESKQNIFDKTFAAERRLNEDRAKLEADYRATDQSAMTMAWDAKYEYIKGWTKRVNDELSKTMDFIGQINSFSGGNVGGGGGGSSKSSVNKSSSPANTTISTPFGGTSRAPFFNDFIQRPGQPATQFSPDDTVIGVKGGLGGTTIIINGDNYGVDANEISESIMKQLRRKIAI